MRPHQARRPRAYDPHLRAHHQIVFPLSSAYGPKYRLSGFWREAYSFPPPKRGRSARVASREGGAFLNRNVSATRTILLQTPSRLSMTSLFQKRRTVIPFDSSPFVRPGKSIANG